MVAAESACGGLSWDRPACWSADDRCSASVTNAATCLTLRGNPCPSQLSTSPLFTPN